MALTNHPFVPLMRSSTMAAESADTTLAWQLGTEGITAPIVEPRTLEQLENVLGADG